MTSEPGFVHLRVHSAYSLSEGAIRVKELVKLCQKLKMPAVAITDTNNLFGGLEFATLAVDGGVQPIIGCQLAIDMAGVAERAEIVVLTQTETGYRNLLKLVSDAHMASEGESGPRVTLEALHNRSDGLICLTGGPAGPLGKLVLAGQPAEAEKMLVRLKALFPGRLYIEIMRHGQDDEKRTETAFLDMAYAHDLPIVATNNCFFSTADMYEAHDALLCIAAGAYLIEDDRRRVTPEHRFKSAAEMRELFADLPEAVDNTIVIARRCSFLLKPIKPILPRYDDPRGEVEAFREKSREGLELRLEQQVFAPGMDKAAREAAAKPYRDRLEFEIGVIENMKFPGYFLIVADFIQWAKRNDIPVGPGRGSGAGSVVAWALTITDVNPIRFGLVFERFLNPERVSMPDFDIDFCQDRRDEVIQYVRRKYGHDRVAQIITFGKLQARAVLRDVGRVMQMPYGQVDRICKMVPNNPAKPVTLQEAIAGDPVLQAMRDEDEQVGRLMDMALKLEGLYRHASTHAAGVVIADRPLDEMVPLYRDPKSDMPVTQFNMKFVEQAGLVKFDFLGLTTLTIIKKAEQLVNATEPDFRMSKVTFESPNTYAMLAKADSAGVFQLESAGMRDALRRIKPTQIDDLVALVALYRPGPMDNIPVYGRVKDGTEPPVYLHPLLEPILKETFSVITYQDDVMQIAKALAGYSMGGADMLRRAMGKKIKSEMEAQKKVFLEGAIARQVEEPVANQIWDMMAKFAEYGFPKAHAAAYAIVTYQTAWLKANHPVEFFAASMTLGMDNTDKLAAFRQELTRLGIPLLPPDINRSEVEFSVDTDAAGVKSIRYALAAVKGVGAQAMAALVQERSQNGPFTDLFDVAKRMDARAMNKRQIENLAHAGAFDALNPNRAQVFAAAETMVRYAAAASDERETGQVNLFGGGQAALPPLKLPIVAAYDALEKLRKEFAAIGFYLSSHPLDAHEKPLKRLGVVQFGALASAAAKGGSTRYKLAGVVVAKQERTSAKGNRFAFLTLSDVSGIYDVTVFSELLAQHRDMMEAGRTLLVTVDAQTQNDDLRLTAQAIEPLDKAIAHVATGLRIVLDEDADLAAIKPLFQAEERTRTKITLSLRLPENREAILELPPAWSLSSKNRAALEVMHGVLEVEDL
jgi:DNA polymerase-3 subunit alpha